MLRTKLMRQINPHPAPLQIPVFPHRQTDRQMTGLSRGRLAKTNFQTVTILKQTRDRKRDSTGWEKWYQTQGRKRRKEEEEEEESGQPDRERRDKVGKPAGQSQSGGRAWFPPTPWLSCTRLQCHASLTEEEGWAASEQGMEGGKGCMQSVIQHWRWEENQTNLSSLIMRREARFEQRKIKMQKSD